MKNSSDLSRREFIGRSVATAALSTSLARAAFSSSPSLKRQAGANDKIVLGLIGCGGMGASNMRTLMQHADVEVAALCDVDDNRIPGDFNNVKSKYGRNPEVYRDYRRMLERKDIDAVIIGTPDHWHALNLIHSVEAGKDVYCEKPISHNIVEAVSMAAAAKHFQRIVQVGTWQRSTREFTDAIGYVRSGKLGKVVAARAWKTDSMRCGKQQTSTPPPGLNYDAWVGPAAFLPYQTNRCHWNWRWFMNFGGGITTDWGVHMMDICLLGMSKTTDLVMPTDVSAYGGRWAILDDDRDSPDVTEAILKFKDPDFVMQWSLGLDHPNKPDNGSEWVGADGRTVRCWRGGWQVLDPNGKELPKEQSDPVPTDHWRNWLDCVKDRSQPRADLSSVAQTTILCQLVNASLTCGETVKWDQSKWDVVGKAGKNTLSYQRPYRKGYELKRYKM